MNDLAIIIVSYNTRDLLRDCLRSIYASEGQVNYTVHVVDNASRDDSVDMVRREFPQVEIVVNTENQGYAAANNAVLEHLQARYALLLNADTVLPSDALEQAVAFMDAHPDVGVMGPKLVRRDGSLDKACRRSFPTPWVAFTKLFALNKLFPNAPRFNRYNLETLDPDQAGEVDAVVGAFMLLRREALIQAGVLDDAFFAFGEDLDLCYRIKAEHGWKVYYNPEITVLHYKGESMKQRSYAMTIEFYKAMWIFHRKHFAADTFFLLNGLIATGIGFLCAAALAKNAFRPPAQKKAGL